MAYEEKCTWKPGDKVIIYPDPLTCLKPAEGRATLLKKVADTGNLERWEVCFALDGFVCERTINKY